MYEGNYCQHKALKPADFKLNGAVLWCLRHSGDVASCGVDRVQWPGLEHPGPHSAPTAKHIAQLAGSYTDPWEPICSCSGLFGKKKKCLDNHHIGIKWNPPQKRKSNQHKVGKQSQLVVTLFRLASRPRVWHSLFTSAQNWVFAVPV